MQNKNNKTTEFRAGKLIKIQREPICMFEILFMFT